MTTTEKEEVICLQVSVLVVMVKTGGTDSEQI